MQQQIPKALKAISIAVDMYNSDINYQENNLIPISTQVDLSNSIGLYKRKDSVECKAILIKQQGEWTFINSSNVKQKFTDDAVILKI